MTNHCVLFIYRLILKARNSTVRTVRVKMIYLQTCVRARMCALLQAAQSHFVGVFGEPLGALYSL